MARKSTKLNANQTAPEPITFEPDGVVLNRFLMDQSEIAIVQGPIGSGKTRTLIMRMIRHCQEQPVQRDGKRRSKWLVVRQTYPELKTTTIAAFLETFPDSPKGDGYGWMSWSPPFTYHFRYGDIEAEFIFLALEKEDDVKKLRSLEVTGIYFNELQYIPLSMFTEGYSRTGRYPSTKDGGSKWAGVIADMNAPEALHWVPIMFGLTPMPDHFTPDQVRQHQRPDGWYLFQQPPALIEVLNDRGEVERYEVNPQAENLRWLRNAGEYYAKKLDGTSKPWIDANLLNRPAAIMKGRAVYPTFSTDRHVSRQPLKFNADLDLYGGFDFGITPAAVFGHYIGGRIYILFEMYAEDIGSDTFAPMVKAELLRRFPSLKPEKVRLYGDPGGDIRVQTDATTAFQIFRKNGMMIQKAPGANRMAGPMGRKDLIERILNRQINGQQAMCIDPSCRMLISGMQGGYQFKDVQSPTGIYKSDSIIKNQYSHVCFVAGTPVSTPSGPVPIEAIKVGDFVTTPQGKRRVRAAMSRLAPALVEVSLSDGSRIVCTPEHPFATRCSFVSAEALQYGQVLIREGDPWEDPRNTRSKSSTASATTTSLQGITKPITSWAGSICTALSGLTTTARYLKAGRSIISTMTRQITPSRTLSFTTAAIMPPSTTKAAQASNRFPAMSGWRLFGTLQRKRDEIPKLSPEWLNRSGARGSAARPLSVNAPTAAKCSSPKEQPKRVSAACPAKAGHVKNLASMISSAFAFTARQFSSRTNTSERGAALVVVRVKSLPQSETPVRVFDLEVDTEHVFYAGGALVSNCEAGQYCILGMGEGTDMLFGGERAKPVKTLQMGRVFDRGARPKLQLRGR